MLPHRQNLNEYEFAILVPVIRERKRAMTPTVSAA